MPPFLSLLFETRPLFYPLKTDFSPYLYCQSIFQYFMLFSMVFRLSNYVELGGKDPRPVRFGLNTEGRLKNPGSHPGIRARKAKKHRDEAKQTS
jgi:hypothetical protein